MPQLCSSAFVEAKAKPGPIPCYSRSENEVPPTGTGDLTRPQSQPGTDRAGQSYGCKILDAVPPGTPLPVGDTAESAITDVVGAMSLSELIEVLAQMKAFVITYPKAARQLLMDHPQIAYAVFMGLIISNIIPFDILTRMMEVNRSRLTVSNHLHLSAAGFQEWQKSENEDDGADDVPPGLTLLATTVFMDHAQHSQSIHAGISSPSAGGNEQGLTDPPARYCGEMLDWDVAPGLGCLTASRHTSTPEEFWRTEMLIAEEELGHALRVLLIQPPEDIEALNRIYTYIVNVVLPHAKNSQEIYDTRGYSFVEHTVTYREWRTVTAAEPGDNWGDEQYTALVDQIFGEFCFAQT
ncbi:hypothetical protein B0H13DRAFT_2319537 [Mycena leptocephala]|nr:hypothetical protein B0H13DRAFT_2319537 [Mycena leptocephala]